MSIFTKRRKAIRQKQEDRKRWAENSKKFDKGCQDVIDTCKYIQEHYPKFDSLIEEKRVKLFAKILNKIHNNNYVVFYRLYNFIYIMFNIS